MKKLMLGLGVAAIVLTGGAIQSEATPMTSYYTGTWTSHWTAIVDYLWTDKDPMVDVIWDIGDEITWSITPANAGSLFHVYNDGPNGIGEFGQNDDTVHHTNYFDYNDSIVDATFSLDAKTTEYIATVPDVTERNYATLYYMERNDCILAEYSSYSRDGFAMRSDLCDKTGHIYNYSLGLDTAVVDYYIVSYTNSPNDSALIPEPATMILLGCGLAGIVGTRLRKKK
jgi:hypothetical protein